jgi:hypothetical protein
MTVTGRNDGPDYPPNYTSRVDTPPIVNDLRQAEFWIGVLHRRSVQDARRIADLGERVRKLEHRPILDRLGRWILRERGTWL